MYVRNSAPLVESVDTQDLKSCAEWRPGSSPGGRTNNMLAGYSVPVRVRKEAPTIFDGHVAQLDRATDF